MLHNSGPFGPNDVPINMGMPVNMTQMLNPMNLGNNLGNLAKVPQQVSQTSAPGYDIPDYSSYGHPPLNMGLPMSPFASYRHVNFQANYSHHSPNLPLDPTPSSVQNTTLPMNLNIQRDNRSSLTNYHNFEGKNNAHYTESFNRKLPINIPQIHTKAFHKHLEMDTNSQYNNSVQEKPLYGHDLSKTPERSIIDSSKRKSLENTVKLIENILINSTPKDKLKSLNCTESFSNNSSKMRMHETNELQDNKTVNTIEQKSTNVHLSHSTHNPSVNHLAEKQMTNSEIKNSSIHDFNPNQSSKIPNHTDLKMGSQNTTSTSIIDILTKHEDTSTSINLSVKSSTEQKQNSTKIQSEIHCEPLRRSLINPSKEQKKETEEIKEPIAEDIKEVDSVEVKVEPLGDDVPFLKDSNAVCQDVLEADVVIVEKNNVAEAQQAIKKGSNTKTYYECTHCKLVFSHPKRFLIHTKWHTFGQTNEKLHELAREKELKKNLKKEARIIERLNSKEVKEATEGDVHPCKDCDKVFTVKSSLKNHRQKYHPTRVRECKICKVSVVGWMQLRAHMAVHAGGAGYQCAECPKRFKYAHSLAKHKDTHLEKTHGCEQCDKKFGSQALLKMHMKCHERTARGATFRCTYCGKGFFESYNLQVHERTHRNERPFLCEICKTSFGTNSSLKRHVKVSHSTLKPFSCPTCHRCFASSTTRARHMSRSHGDPVAPHACAACPRRYTALKELQKHVSKTHSERRE